MTAGERDRPLIGMSDLIAADPRIDRAGSSPSLLATRPSRPARPAIGSSSALSQVRRSAPGRGWRSRAGRIGVPRAGVSRIRLRWMGGGSRFAPRGCCGGAIWHRDRNGHLTAELRSGRYHPCLDCRRVRTPKERGRSVCGRSGCAGWVPPARVPREDPSGRNGARRLDSLRCEQLSAMKARTAAGDVF